MVERNLIGESPLNPTDVGNDDCNSNTGAGCQTQTAMDVVKDGNIGSPLLAEVSVVNSPSAPPVENEILSPELKESIELTIRSLRKHLNHPPLTAKYLKQPPFLYMHDLTTNVIKKHGLLSNLFTAEELNRHIAKKTKENRINFFKKLVAALRATTGEALNVDDWRKLAIGHIPLASNEILQCIGFALDNNMNSTLAVRKLTGFGTFWQVGPTDLKRAGEDEMDFNGDSLPSGFESNNKRFRHLTIWDLDEDDIDYDYDFCNDTTSNTMGQVPNAGRNVADTSMEMDDLAASFETQMDIS